MNSLDLVRYACQAFGWSDSKGVLANDLYDREVVQFGSFTLNNLKLSTSPIYFNLRTPDHPTNPGKLTPRDAENIAAELFSAVQASGIEYDLVAGIPHAGEPFAKAFLRHTKDVCLATFEKTEQGRICCYDMSNEARRSGKFIERTPQVLLIDDVLSSGNSALEAMDAILDKSYGGYVAGQFVCLVDREQGGLELLEKRGYKVISVFRLSQLLTFYVLTARISRTNFEDIMSYIERSRKIITAS